VTLARAGIIAAGLCLAACANNIAPPRPATAEVLDRLQRRADARVVTDAAVVERHVEVDAHQHAPAAQVAEVVDPRAVRHGG